MRNRARAVALLALFAALPAAAFAQQKVAPAASSDGQFEPGSKMLSVDLLLGGTGDYAGVGAAAAFEVGVAKFAERVTLGVGAQIGYITESRGYGYGYSVDQVPIFLLANGHYQLTQIPKLDLYGGVSLGFVHASYSYDNAVFHSDYSTTDVAGGVQIGGRWAFSDHVSAMAQVGEGVRVPILTAGVTFRF